MGAHPTAARAVEVIPACHEDGCGLSADIVDESDPTLDGWILVRVNGSGMPARWYCCGRCAHIGIARAQLCPEVPPAPATPPATALPRTSYTPVRFMPRGRLVHLAAAPGAPGGPVLAECGQRSKSHTTAGTTDLPLCSRCQTLASKGNR